MNVFVFILSALLAATTQAAVKKMNCGPNERGVSMEVVLTPTEATVPIYNVKLSQHGRVYKQFNAHQKTDSRRDFQAQGYDTEYTDTILYVGYSYSSREGYYQQAANNGMSPLPGTFFSNCVVR